MDSMDSNTGDPLDCDTCKGDQKYWKKMKKMKKLLIYLTSNENEENRRTIFC